MSRRISAGQPDKPGHLSELRGNGIAVLTFALLSTPLNLPAFGLGITSSVLLLCFSRPEDIHIEAPRISRLALGTAIFAGLAAALGLVVGVFGASNVCNAAAEYALAQEYPHCVPDGPSGTVVCYSYTQFLGLQQRSCAGRRDFAVAIIIWALAVQLPLALSAALLSSKAARVPRQPSSQRPSNDFHL